MARLRTLARHKLLRIDVTNAGDILVVDDNSGMRVQATDGDVAKKILKTMYDYYKTHP